MILNQIVADKRLEIAKSRAHVSSAEIRACAEDLPPTRNFANALRGENVALIAEIKPASPSRGEIRAEVNPAQIARVYAENGAAAISVLTDRKYFRGEPNNLQMARGVCEKSLLRKDFVIDEYQVYESRVLQVDAILLIVRILDDAQLRDYRALAESLGMAVLVEIHDEQELERALVSGANIIGINNRNLADFSTDLAITERLAQLVPPECTIVSESGIFSRADVERVAQAGADAVLVGEALMRAEDIGAKVKELSQARKYKNDIR